MQSAEYVEVDSGKSDFEGLRICMVAPFPPRKGGVTVQTDLLVRYLEKEGAEILKVDTNLQKLRIPIIGTPVRLLIQPWVVAFRLLRSVRRCDLVHIQAASNWGYLPAVIGAPISMLFRKHCVLTYHGGKGPLFMDRFPWLVKTPFKLSTHASVVSLELKEAFKQRGVETVLINNLFDSDIFKYRERNTIRPKLVWTRALEDVYDPMAALNVFEIVRSRYPDATLVMAGDGSLKATLASYIKDRNLDGVTLTGKLCREEIADVLNSADIYLNTSKQDGLPTSLLEASASGLPIVTTNAGGIASLFNNGVNAIVVGVGNVEAMSNAVTYLLEHNERAKHMGVEANKLSVSYTWLNTSGDIARFYGLSER